MDVVNTIESKGYKLIKNMAVICKDMFIEQPVERRTFAIQKPNGEYVMPIGYLDTPITIGGILTTRREIIRELYPEMTENDWCRLEYHYSIKTKAYLGKVMEQYGIISVDESDKEPDLSNDDTVYQDSYYTGEEVITKTFRFKKKPDSTDIQVAYGIFEMQLAFDRASEEITCAECGNTMHWTETDGNFLQKVKNFNDKFCGYCDCDMKEKV